MRLTFLGTGTSLGVPIIGCRCPVCISANPRNRRTRTAALLDVAGLRLLIDAGPDFRQQALTARLEHLDAVLLTHAHADHISGLDDLRPINMRQRAAMPVFASAHTLAAVRDRFAYAFVDGSAGSTRPLIDLVSVEAGQTFTIGTVTVLPLAVQHGTWDILGYRIGGLGYITDASQLPAATLDALHGLDALVINALRREPHPTHFSLEQALAVVAELQPRRAFVVHMGHDLEHEATNASLPPHIRLAHDGLVVAVNA